MQVGSMIATAALALVVGASSASAKPPKFYFQLRGVQAPAKSPASVKDKAKEVLIAELKKQPSVVLDLGQPATPEQLAEILKARKLDGYELMLRVVKSGHSLQPPPAGKLYKMLMVEVEVAIDAQKIPSGQMALAGEGSAQVGTEVKTVNEKEKLQLLGEALEKSISEAVAKSIKKLGAAKYSKPPRAKKK
jgi:hypothetical protein